MENLDFGFEVDTPPLKNEKITFHGELDFVFDLLWQFNVWRLRDFPEGYRLILFVFLVNLESQFSVQVKDKSCSVGKQASIHADYKTSH